MIDSKPRKRHRATIAEWVQIRDMLAEESCWVCGGPWVTVHHILPRAQGGDDVLENLAPVCGTGTIGCHGRLEAHDSWARSQIRHALMPSHLRYLDSKVHDATAWLQRNYPVTP